MLFIYIPLFGQLPKTGLYFYAHKVNVDQRTSLILNNKKAYELNKNDIFSLEFDVFLRDELIKFGDIFRIISNKNEYFDLIINNEQDRFLIISEQVDNEFHSQTCRFTDINDKDRPIANKWSKVILVFDKSKNQIRFKFNNNETICHYDLSEVNSLLIYFGVCNYLEGFSMLDVSPIILKDIVINKNGKTINQWGLDKHASQLVYDEVNRTPALPVNPLWMKDNSVYWHKAASFTLKNYPQLAFDSASNTVYLFNEQNYIRYSVALDKSETHYIKNPISLNSFNNQIIFDSSNKQIVSYNISPATISYFDFVTDNWESTPAEAHDMTHAQHNRYFNPIDTTLILFGGYGYYTFKSDLFKVDLKSNRWSNHNLSQSITPRYLAAMGANPPGDKIYLFGGRGAELGLQELASKNFSDLHEIDLKTLKSKFLYDFPEGTLNKNYVYSSNLIVDDKDSCFYVLAYPNNKFSSHILLKKISLNKPVETILGDTIKFYFQDVSSFCDLYYSSSLAKLIAVATYSTDNNITYSVNIFTLDYPPLALQDIKQYTTAPFSFNNYMKFIELIIVCVVLFFVIQKFQFKKKKIVAQINPEDKDLKEKDPKAEKIEPPKKFYERSREAIFFLGGFQVFNQKGNNITKEFTPTVKSILVLIVLYTIKNEKGISSSQLQDILWFDKNGESARNNRNVNIRKLRLLLQEVGDIDISNKEGYWKLVPGKIVFSDYIETLRLIKEIKAVKGDDVNDVWHLLELLSYGVLLPNIQQEWIDSFKTDFSDTVIDILIFLLNKERYMDMPTLRLQIADTILIYDTISEEAIKTKCELLYILGKKGSAKTAFDNFVKEYKLLLGEPYPHSFNSIIGA